MSVSNEIAKQESGPAAMVRQYSGDFATVLPSHIKPTTWVRLAQGALRRNQDLARAAERNPASLMAALLECARLGHEPGTESFYLVPFGSEVTGIEGYRGVVERMYRAGAVATVKAEIVKKNDHFRYEPQTMSTPDHKPDWFGDRGETVGAYAFAEMKDGTTSRVVVIGRDYIEKVKRESKGSKSPSSPWVKWEDQMILKTVAHRLEPWVPTSSEYLKEQLRAMRDVEAEVTQLPATPPVPTKVFDGEVEPPTAIEQAPAEEPAGDPGVHHDRGHPGEHPNGPVHLVAWSPNCELCEPDEAGKGHYLGHAADEPEESCSYCQREVAWIKSGKAGA